MDTNQAVELLQSAAAAMAAARLIYFKLPGRFPALFAWLLLIAAGNFISAVISSRSAIYFWFYFSVITLVCIADVVAVRELFALIFIDYPGIRSIGRWGMYTGIILATAASILISRIFPRNSMHGSRHLFDLEVAQRSIIFTLAIVIITILFCISKYPLHLTRNTYISSALFSIFFLSDAARLLIDSLAPYLLDNYVDWTTSVVLAACLATWAALLRPAPAMAVPDPVPSPYEEHLLEQLASLNQILGRVARQ